MPRLDNSSDENERLWRLFNDEGSRITPLDVESLRDIPGMKNRVSEEVYELTRNN